MNTNYFNLGVFKKIVFSLFFSHNRYRVLPDHQRRATSEHPGVALHRHGSSSFQVELNSNLRFATNRVHSISAIHATSLFVQESDADQLWSGVYGMHLAWRTTRRWPFATRSYSYCTLILILHAHTHTAPSDSNELNALDERILGAQRRHHDGRRHGDTLRQHGEHHSVHH